MSTSLHGGTAGAIGEARVASASSGSEAIDGLAASPFDIVVTDLHLPGANGIQVARVARRLNPAAVVIVATGGGSAADEAQALAAGASLWLTKPFDVDQVIEFLRAEVERQNASDTRRDASLTFRSSSGACSTRGAR